MDINHETVATRLMIDSKHQPDRVLVIEFWIEFLSKNLSKLYTFLESTYPEMQRKHIPRVY